MAEELVESEYYRAWTETQQMVAIKQVILRLWKVYN